MLDAGYLDRLRLAFVEIEEIAGNPRRRRLPRLRCRSDARRAVGDQLASSAIAIARTSSRASRGASRPIAARGREAAARSHRARRRAAVAVSLSRPRSVCRRGHSFEALDTLPLAAEPYAAAVDVVLECAAANFTRRALMALLRSPHFRFEVDGAEIDRASIAALDVAMAEQRYLGGLDRLRALAERMDRRRTAGRAAPRSTPRSRWRRCSSRGRWSIRSSCCARSSIATIATHDERRRRARAAVVKALDGLVAAYRRHDPAATGTVTELSAAIRRWLGTQTFEVATTPGGIRILDAQAARFAELDDVQIMGLVEGEWPERPRRNVFYPRSLVAQLEPSRPERVAVDEERDHVRSARAMFRDLIGLAATAHAAVDVRPRIRIGRRAIVVHR